MEAKLKPTYGLDRQREIYLGGMAGRKPEIPFHFDELETLAKKRLRSNAFHYIKAGAGSGQTIDNNTCGFNRLAIVPRMLRDVSNSDMSCNFMGVSLPAPIMLAPIGVLSLAHRDGDLAVAGASSSTGIPMAISNQASVAVEKVASRLSGTPFWFQLYWSRSRELVSSFVKRAEAYGSKGIIITVDTTMLGWRPLDLSKAYLPFLHGKGLAQYLSDPVFNAMVESRELTKTKSDSGRPTITAALNLLRLYRGYPGNFFSHLRSQEPLQAVRLFTQIYTNPQLNWDDLKYLRDITHLPLLLKGILHPEDAVMAQKIGIQGLVVSNHGGRQVDGAVSSIEQIPLIRQLVGDDFPLILDSGVRTGADIIKALHQGADLVSIGRPYVYALSIGGESGVQEYLRNLRADLDLHMRLSGCCNLQDIKKCTIKKI